MLFNFSYVILNKEVKLMILTRIINKKIMKAKNIDLQSYSYSESLSKGYSMSKQKKKPTTQ